MTDEDRKIRDWNRRIRQSGNKLRASAPYKNLSRATARAHAAADRAERDSGEIEAIAGKEPIATLPSPPRKTDREE